MQFYSRLLPNGRWGIYEGNTLLATVGCLDACQEIIGTLQQRQSLLVNLDETPETVNDLYLERLNYFLNLQPDESQLTA